MKSLDHSKKGFTLIEGLISIAVFSLLFGMTAMGASHLAKRLTIGPSDAYLQNILLSAARRARDGVGDSDWGVYIPFDETERTLNEVVIFKGTTYATRDTDFDQSFSFSDKTDFVSSELSGVLVSDGDDHEVVFEKFSGQTDHYGSIELEVFGVSRTLVVTKNGFVTREL